MVAVTPYLVRFINFNSDRYMYGELGLIENLTVIFLIVAIIACIFFLLSENSSNLVSVRVWILLFLIGCIYYLGEEISWGQHYFGWATPEGWSSVNDQQETNLHNTSPLFDQIPQNFTVNSSDCWWGVSSAL